MWEVYLPPMRHRFSTRKGNRASTRFVRPLPWTCIICHRHTERAHSSAVEPPAHNRPVPGSNPGGPTSRANGGEGRRRYGSDVSLHFDRRLRALDGEEILLAYLLVMITIICVTDHDGLRAHRSNFDTATRRRGTRGTWRSCCLTHIGHIDQPVRHHWSSQAFGPSGPGASGPRAKTTTTVP